MRSLSAAVNESGTVKVWDPFVRVFHWSLAASFFAAYFIEGGDTAHESLGYVALGLVTARIVWGFIGAEHARFARFVPTPQRLFAYLRDALARREARFLGHNPAGAVMILALLCAVSATGLTGWLLTTEAFWGEEVIEELHEACAHVTLALVALHVAGALYESKRHGENLVLAMITGRKRKR